MNMMGNPTKFNNIESGVISSQPVPLRTDDVNRLVNTRSLQKTNLAEFVNERSHQKEKPHETPSVPLAK
jgi:hypothetical protein